MNNENLKYMPVQSTPVIYEKARRNSVSPTKKRINKKNLKQKRIKSAIIAIIFFVLGLLATFGIQLFKGSENIGKEFFEYTKGYEIIFTGGGDAQIINPDGISIITFQAGEGVTMEAAYPYMIKEYKDAGATNAEAWIGAAKVWGKNYADDYVGEITFEEKITTKLEAYHETSLEELKEYNGGISK